MEYLLKDFGKIIKRNYHDFRPLFAEDDTDVMRIYDRNITDLPLTVDLYGKYAVVNDYRSRQIESEIPRCPIGESDASEAEIRGRLPDQAITDQSVGDNDIIETVASMLYRTPDHVFLFKRIKPSYHRQPQPDTGAQMHPVVSTVKEHGLLYKIEIGLRLDTGLFIDHSVTRSLVLKESARKAVLNLFSYTGSFSLCAASGGAARVVSVDLSRTYLDWARENFRLNKLIGGDYQFERMDCLQYLESAAARSRGKGLFDLIIIDPPSFSNSRNMDGTFDIQRDHAGILTDASALLSAGGAILFSTNLSSFSLSADLRRSFSIEDITRDTIPPGFSVRRPPHRCWIIRKRTRTRGSRHG